LLSCLETEEPIYRTLFEQIRNSSIEKVKYYFSLILPLYSENIIIAPSLWESYGEREQIGITHLLNLFGSDSVVMSWTLSFAMQNASKDKNFDYSKRVGADLFA